MKNRRQMLTQSAALAGLAATAGWLPATALAYSKDAFDAKSVADALKAVGVTGAPTESKDVTITGPDIAENGAVVPLSVATALPGVKQLMLLVEKNPNAVVAIFNTSEFVESNFTTRAKLGQSSDVYAIAVMNDGKALFAKKEVKVTLGGCGG
ncbi:MULTISPECIES: thiosulfate oxidation carrier protein SoxY [Variovorax]|jgi:sulfur-oxidizing protein SoxY|uniref:Thiosulfate oxidation carrier protein SoxY n=1 Tax=Variovorax boronicumulans TaxID=436515 RepID=A0A250DS10_9BURK|nr:MULTISPECIES: thiosulfate oxidation carrier protein SoxY [Variovorax]ATA57146.1 thiosulfate oxidation carrier protein SoxY [Variovorax boronicumulans]KQX89432.1 thiosulfate oxidation carrier protein SoxY [Variovorax sp. Root473]MDP9911346.1 sulfur-oxidizing protein SoxY [Variovorax boronicumulans]MDP9914458.1 sulfur-oxidizing protein SoxY [Variovorax boronicumulans]TSD53218.1 thiosulfate oxidation carrier protein SoxY [Variovorax sp. KBS0712]